MSEPKIRIKTVTVSRAEGWDHECVTIRAASFEAADAVLRRMAHTAPEDGSYHKTDVTVEFEDGESFKIRYDLTRDDVYNADVAAHFRREIGFYSGRWRPAHVTEQTHEIILSRYPDQQRIALARLYDGYELERKAS